MNHQNTEERACTRESKASTNTQTKQLPGEPWRATRNSGPKLKSHHAFDNVPIGAELLLEKQGSGEGKTLKWSKDYRPLSLFTDEPDEIYKEADPIGVSLQKRIDRGATVTTVLRDTYSTNGRFFFNLRLKEPKVVHVISDDDSSSDRLPFVLEEENSDDQDDDTKNSYNPNFSFSVKEVQKDY